MTEHRHIVFLTGFMGSGKSTIGPGLAKKIGYSFIDMDKLIEKSEGMSVHDIFERHGEEHFRRAENETLRTLSESKEHIVVALGGGALSSEANRRLVHSAGVLVYLKAAPETILRRVGRNRKRPMLLNSKGDTMGDEELSARVETLLKEREVYYLEADIIVDTSESTVLESVGEIGSKLKGLIK